MAEDVGDGDGGGVDQRLLRLASEPIRVRALCILNERTAGASVSDIAEELELSVGETARHLREMHESGLVELVGEVLGRGAIEPCYRAAVRLLWNDDEWAELSVAERRRVSAWVVHMINEDVCEALEHGAFNARADAHTSRSISMLDEQGWRELSRIYSDALNAVFAVHEASKARLAESGEEGFRVISALICGELPPLPSAKSD